MRRTRSTRRALLVAVCLSPLIALAAWQAYPFRSNSFDTVSVSRGSIESSVSALGTLQPRRYVDVGAQASGQIRKLHVEAGDDVTEGQLLVEIDPSTQQAKVDAGRYSIEMLKAQLAEQRAQYTLARQQYQRQQRLAAGGATRTEDVQSAQAQMLATQARIEMYQAQIRQAQASLRSDEAELGYTRIYAPMSGTVVAVDAREGQTLNAQQQTPLILRIAKLSPMTVWARYGSKVPAKVVAWNHVGGSGLTVAPEIADVRQLGGKSVAIPFWYSIHNVVLQQLLRDNGLRAVSRAVGAALAADEVNLVVLPPSDMPPALASKRIHGYIVAEPFNALAENLKVGRVQRFTGDVWRNHACCVVFMHEHDLERRPQWSQKVVNAIVKAQLWTREHRAEAAQLLSKAGANRYTPHAPEVLGRVLAPGAEEQQAYLASGAIRHADWQERRIDFQPYPYPSYTEELVRRLKDTLIEGNNAFLASLDPRQVASDLVDDRFVRQALAEVGGLQAFGLAEGFQRSEEISP
ncbi:efflux RND transporter periplasmic adaptor subunit [Pseudomonas aeruginosa]|nr:efflux RND transporter periplasmic adaptor subunit [Pseudomonas aeruginosa]